MPLSALYFVPRNNAEWSNWSFNNADSHNRIIDAIFRQKKILLSARIVDPIPWSSLADWLRNHQEMHNEMDAVLGIDATDLTVPQFNNPSNVEAFVLQHADEHKAAEGALGIG